MSERGGVLIELGGKTRTLRYDYNAIADVEEKAGLGAETLFTEERAGFHVLRLLVWAGLRWADRGITPARAGDLIQKHLTEGGSLEELMGKVTEALRAAELQGNAQAGTAEPTE